MRAHVFAILGLLGVGCAGSVDVEVVRVPIDAPAHDPAHDPADTLPRGFADDDGTAAPGVADPVEDPLEDPIDPIDPIDDVNLFVLAGLPAPVAADAARALGNARLQGLVEGSLFTVIDFSQPSTQRRLWTLNIDDAEVLVHDHVSHGSGSNSEDDAAMAALFSNTSGSLQSSLGLARTAETYQGSNGYSLRLDGLEASNDNMRDRAIVMHGASYAEDAFIDANGYLGRSSGCPAVALSRSAALIDLLKEGTLLFSWFPDQSWRASSPFLR